MYTCVDICVGVPVKLYALPGTDHQCSLFANKHHYPIRILFPINKSNASFNGSLNVCGG